MGKTQNRLVEKNRKKENDMALMMMAIVVVFVICNIFSGIFWISFSYCLVSKAQYIYIKTVSSRRLSDLLNWFKLVYESFEQSRMHCTLDFCPNQPEGIKCAEAKK